MFLRFLTVVKSLVKRKEDRTASVCTTEALGGLCGQSICKTWRWLFESASFRLFKFLSWNVWYNHCNDHFLIVSKRSTRFLFLQLKKSPRDAGPGLVQEGGIDTGAIDPLGYPTYHILDRLYFFILNYDLYARCAERKELTTIGGSQ